MRLICLVFTLGLVALCLPAQTNVVVAGGAAPDGFNLWGRAGRTVGIEGAFTRAARETERTLFWVRCEENETVESGVSLRLRAARFAGYGSAGISRETAVGSFEFLYPEPSGRFGGVEQRVSPYVAATGTFRLFWRIHAVGRYTWRSNSDFVERQAITAGLALEF